MTPLNPYTAAELAAAKSQSALPRSDQIGPDGEDISGIIEPIGEHAIAKEPRQRWWTVLLVTALGLICTIVTASTLMAVMTIWKYGIDGLSEAESFQELSQTRSGFLTLVIFPQIALIAPVIVAAIISPIKFSKRLGLVRGHWPWWIWIAAAMATPLVGMLSGLVTSQFMQESANLKEMGESFRFLGSGWFALIIAMAIGLTPAICEEILFRGYGQTRLVKSFPPVAGILFSSALFAAFHLDPVHVITVFPLGLWLGIVSYHSGSLFPAMMGHFVNNFVSVLLIIFGEQLGGGDVAGGEVIGVDEIGAEVDQASKVAAEVATELVPEMLALPSAIMAMVAMVLFFGGLLGLFLTIQTIFRQMSVASKQADAREPEQTATMAAADKV